MTARQPLLFPEFAETKHALKPVNVASVPQRSPFRYPGGKTWFVPVFRDWVSNHFPRPTVLIEPFAGGGIISLTALFEKLVPKVVMVEIDNEISAVWKTIVNGDIDWLANRILSFDLTLETVKEELSQPAQNDRELAFKTILKNRTFHGGIITDGAGFLKKGENGKGISSRWYPTTLARRLNEMKPVVQGLTFRQENGLDVISEFASNPEAIFFIDPPYTAGGKNAGRRLYRHFAIDHEQLFSICKSIKGDFLMTYDDSEEVKAHARNHGFQMRLVPMKNTHNTTMKELVIGKNLKWMDTFPQVCEPKAEFYSTADRNLIKKKIEQVRRRGK